jgi:type I site-specific restriction-modification system R (restriction) subunit
VGNGVTDGFDESTIEEAALAWLEGLGWARKNGAELAPDAPEAERADFGQVVLEARLKAALVRLNPELPAEALDDAFRKLTRPEGADLVTRNGPLHRLMVEGVTVEYRTADGTIRGAQARVLDFDDAGANDWLAVNQLAVVENRHGRRPDLVLFINGLPLAVLELKNAADEQATIDAAFRQLQTYKQEIPSLFAWNAVASEEVVDVFAAAGLKKPDISILSDEFLAETRGMKQRNLAVELLGKLLKDQIRIRGRKNLVQARSFTEMLEEAIRRYQNRAIETAQVLEELIGLAKQMRAAAARGEALDLSDDELAFYDALEVNDSAVKILGDETLRTIARELVATVRQNVTIDWTLRENVRAQLRVIVKRILRKHGYPPDKQEKATQTVLEQAALLSAGWAIG